MSGANASSATLLERRIDEPRAEATAQLALGRHAEARSIAREQLELVQPFGAPGPIGVAFRTLVLIEHGRAQLDLLRWTSPTAAH
jgi:hypothetical protein